MRQTDKRKIKKKVYSWWSVVILVVIAFFFINNTWDVYKKYAESKGNIINLQDSYDIAQMREGELRSKISYLGSERGLEEEIREKFNVVKDGEQVVVIINSNIEEDYKEVEKSNVVKRLWSKMLDAFR